MSVILSPLGGMGAQFLDTNGKPLSGGKLYTYEAGTTTPLAAYTTNTGTVAHTNPIVLDSAGRVPGGQVWLAFAAYKFVLTTDTDVAVATWDNAQTIDATDVPFTPPSGVGFDTDTDTVAKALGDLADNLVIAAPTGVILMFPGITAPFGWLICDGSVVATVDYPDLFGVIGNAFNSGGEGAGNFRLPDFRGRFPLGLGDGTDLTERVLGAKGGEEAHALTYEEMHGHDHIVADHSHGYDRPVNSTAFIPYENTTSGSGDIPIVEIVSGSTGAAGSTTSVEGSNGAHNNMPPFLVVNFIVKT